MRDRGRSRAPVRRPSPRLDAAQVVDVYGRWAPIYDLVFAAVMRRGRAAAARAAGRFGGRVLDVGVGTGLELPMFDAGLHVTGVDLSEAMLRRAQHRVARRGLRQVAGLLVMDGTRLGFRDASFDAVLAPYVLSVVPDPSALLTEMLRVLRTGGELVLVNHFGAERGLAARLERWLGRHSATLGWHPNFAFAALEDWLDRTPGVALVERRTVPPLGLFTLVRLAKAGA